MGKEHVFICDGFAKMNMSCRKLTCVMIHDDSDVKMQWSKMMKGVKANELEESVRCDRFVKAEGERLFICNKFMK